MTSGGAAFNVSGKLKTGATAVADPYAGRTAPTVGACGSTPTSARGGGYRGNYSSPGTPTTIYPGVYCGDLAAGGPLTLSPGVYIVKGNFKDQGGSSGDPSLSSGACVSSTNKAYVNGTSVTIYLTGGGTVQASSCLSLTAPTTGTTAGMAVWDAGTGGTDAFSGGSNLAITGALTRQITKSITREARLLPAVAPKLWRILFSLTARQVFKTPATA